MSTFRLRALKLSDLDNHTADSPGKQTRPAPSNWSDCPFDRNCKEGQVISKSRGSADQFHGMLKSIENGMLQELEWRSLSVSAIFPPFLGLFFELFGRFSVHIVELTSC
jgi:hypothetical protein